ncbi:hypothetical protein K7432_000884 [Basidiobolus ranarum]|uniref:L domain-like protein n=1 Tax=Basidiobolus ranarum TaxID=34480 RepID=A0ABR2X3X5_9FUNG
MFIDNNLGGTLPTDIGKLRRLRVLSLINTRTTGNIPASIGNLKRLRVFSIFRSQFIGSVPTELVQLPLKYINLNENRLSGSIPSAISELRSATYIGLRGNNFTGQVPNIQMEKQGAHCDLGGSNEWSCKSSNVSAICTGIENLQSCARTIPPSQSSTPVDRQSTEDKRNIIIGFSVLGGVVALTIITLFISWRRKTLRNKKAIAMGKERMLENAVGPQTEEVREPPLSQDIDSAIGIPSTSKVPPIIPLAPIVLPSERSATEEHPAKQKHFMRPFKPIQLMKKLRGKAGRKAKDEPARGIQPQSQSQPSPKPQRRSVINPSFWNESGPISSTDISSNGKNQKNKPAPIKIIPYEEAKVSSAPSSPRLNPSKASRSFSAPPSPTIQKKSLDRTPVSPVFTKYLAESSKPVPPLTSLHTTTGQVEYPTDKDLKKILVTK